MQFTLLQWSYLAAVSSIDILPRRHSQSGRPYSCYHLLLRNLIGQIHEKALYGENFWTGVLELQKSATKSHTLTVHHWYRPEGRIQRPFRPQCYCAGTHQWTARALSKCTLLTLLAVSRTNK